ncbi:MAG: hypothetical protein U1F48_07015 [Burkholderiales bacterium]
MLALVLALHAASAAALGVATWNLQWLQDADAHAQWVTVCARNGWPQDTSRLPPAERAALAGLPYCDVHNGMVFPPDRCRSSQDRWPLAARYPDAHPCRESADLATPERYAEKLAQLRAMFLRLEAAGVGLVAVQEVSSAAALRAIVPPGWSVATTRELPGTPAIAQHVGVAWKRGVAVRDVELVASLADSGLPERPLRPGLAFTVDVGGRSVRALAVHLKAGCRSRDLDAPLTTKDVQSLSPERKDAVSNDCALLRYQVPALEGWIDAHAAQDFAVLGDFNRTLLREPVADSDRYKTRHDGGSAASPVGPCTLRRDGARVTADCPARTRALFPELNDNDPPGAVLWRARYAKKDGECRIAGPHGVLTHSGIDHVVISESLKRRLTPEALALTVVNYEDADGAPLRAAPEHAVPSDHCPHVVTWTARRP